MTDSEKLEFGEALTALGALFNRELDKAVLLGYWTALRDLSLEDFHRGVQRAFRDCKFMPLPVELRELSGELPVEAMALRAWDEVNYAIDLHGSYQTVDFEDRVINAVIASFGGWPRFCETAASEFWKWRRKEFIDTYSAMARFGIGPEQGAPLMGIHGRENGSMGYQQPTIHIPATYPVPALPDAEPAAPMPALANVLKGLDKA